ncbi:hypothetical protein [Nocardiopsis synnemataformans]|uniref:hypothetical protein n=1 Tax=Nocardiopsis synnemataformans TaxID=61305 RepID=UPI003EBC623E
MWFGIDAGKAHHGGTAIDNTDASVWTQKFPSDEPAILDTLLRALVLADEAL